MSGVQLCRANRLWELLVKFEIARPMNLLKLLILQVIPRLQDIALIATIVVPRWQQNFEFFAQIVFDFIAISVVKDLYKLFVADHAIVIQLERLNKLDPFALTLHQSIQLVEDLYFDFCKILVVIRVGVFELTGNRPEMASLFNLIRGIALVRNDRLFHILDRVFLVVLFLLLLRFFLLVLLLGLGLTFFFLNDIFASLIIILVIRRVSELAVFQKLTVDLTGFNPARALGVSLSLLVYGCDFLVALLAWSDALLWVPQPWRWLIYFIIRYYFLGDKLVNQVHLLNKSVGILRVLQIVLQLASQLLVDVTSVGLSHVHDLISVELQRFGDRLLDFGIGVFFKEFQ